MNRKEVMAERDGLYADVNARIQALDDFVENNDENAPDFMPKLVALQQELEVSAFIDRDNPLSMILQRLSTHLTAPQSPDTAMNPHPVRASFQTVSH